MKTRDSGMPEEARWTSFFDPDAIFDALALHEIEGPTIDVGCGYGTFTLALARRSRHPVIGLDIEADMVETTASRAREVGLDHVQTRHIDVTEQGFGIAPDSATLVLLFNLLHCEDSLGLLRMAHASLRPGGRVAVIHWRCDIPTPRGPDLSIRPRPEALQRWLEEAGFTIARAPQILPPYHVGLVGIRPTANARPA